MYVVANTSDILALGWVLLLASVADKAKDGRTSYQISGRFGAMQNMV